ncbi:MAG: LCP family protein [Nostoc sp.]
MPAGENHSGKAFKQSNKNAKKPILRSSLWFWLRIGGVAMGAAIAGTLLAVSFTSKPLQKTQLNQQQQAAFNGEGITGSGLQFSALSRPVNILVLGMSVLPPDIKNPPPETLHMRYQPELNSFDGLSDVMLLLRFEPEKKKLIMLSIPRDTRIEVSGHGMTKINATNVYGGPALTSTAVSNLLDGVEIDRYIRINVLGVSKLVDALGGVTVYVPKNMKYRDDSQHLYINLKAGKQHLNGEQALQLLRFRHDELGDIGRIQRQQMVISALTDQTLNPATLSQLPKILDIVKEHIDSNLTVEELVALLDFMVQTHRSNMQMLMVPGRFSEKKEYDASYWIADNRHIGAMMAKYFDLDSEPKAEVVHHTASLRIAFQDSTGTNQANLHPLIKILEKAGYHNIYITKSWGEPLEVTRIIAQQGDGDSAESIRNALNLGEVRVESTGNLYSDVSIQVGKDSLQASADTLKQQSKP